MIDKLQEARRDRNFYVARSKDLGHQVERLQRHLHALKDRLKRVHRNRRLTLEQWTERSNAISRRLKETSFKDKLTQLARRWRKSGYDAVETSPHFAFWFFGASEAVNEILSCDKEEDLDSANLVVEMKESHDTDPYWAAMKGMKAVVDDEFVKPAADRAFFWGTVTGVVLTVVFSAIL